MRCGGKVLALASALVGALGLAPAFAVSVAGHELVNMNTGVIVAAICALGAVAGVIVMIVNPRG